MCLVVLEKHWQNKWDQWPLKAAQYLPAEQHHSSHHHHITLAYINRLSFCFTHIIYYALFGIWFSSRSITIIIIVHPPIQNSNRQKPLVNFIFILAGLSRENGNYLLWTCTPKKYSSFTVCLSQLHCISYCIVVHFHCHHHPVLSTYPRLSQHNKNTHIIFVMWWSSNLLQHHHAHHNNMFMLMPFTPSFHPFYFVRPSHKASQLTFHFVLFSLSFAQPNKPEKTNGTSHYHPHHHLRTYILTPPIYILHTWSLDIHTWA